MLRRQRKLRTWQRSQNLMSLDEFLTWEREQPERHEFDGFIVTAMTGASLAHVTITINLATTIRQMLRGTGCRPFASDAKVIAAGSVRYPDIAVTCHPVDGRDDVVPDPVVIMEVISPSTERVDRRRKKLEYFETPSIREYAIVEQDERRVDLYTRTETGWINEVLADEAVLSLSSIGVEIGLDAIYEDTDLDTTRQRVSEAPAPAG